VPRQRRPSQNWLWEQKLSQMQNLGGGFGVFFLVDQNRNFEKVRGLKLLLSLKKIIKKKKVIRNSQITYRYHN